MNDDNPSLDADLPRPWHHEPFVWMIISFPLTAVIAGFVTLYLAIDSYDGLVVDDYYKRGLEINRLLDREQLATDLGLAMDVHIEPNLGNVEIDISARQLVDFPARISGTLTNATKPGLDQALAFKQQSGGRYRAYSQPLGVGRWHLIVSTEAWRVIKQVAVTVDGRVTISGQ